jgi:hypothetical protein
MALAIKPPDGEKNGHNIRYETSTGWMSAIRRGCGADAVDSELIGFLTQEFRNFGGSDSGHRRLLPKEVIVRPQDGQNGSRHLYFSQF